MSETTSSKSEKSFDQELPAEPVHESAEHGKVLNFQAKETTKTKLSPEKETELKKLSVEIERLRTAIPTLQDAFVELVASAKRADAQKPAPTPKKKWFGLFSRKDGTQVETPETSSRRLEELKGVIREHLSELDMSLHRQETLEEELLPREEFLAKRRARLDKGYLALLVETGRYVSDMEWLDAESEVIEAELEAAPREIRNRVGLKFTMPEHAGGTSEASYQEIRFLVGDFDEVYIGGISWRRNTPGGTQDEFLHHLPFSVRQIIRSAIRNISTYDTTQFFIDEDALMKLIRDKKIECTIKNLPGKGARDRGFPCVQLKAAEQARS